MRRFLLVSLSALALSACATQPTAPVASAPPATAPAKPEPAPLSALVAAVDIPYESFTLANGLTVLVHTDRKAPIVGVTTYYRIGSKHEPRGKTGFAHLYEHIFFGGSENVPNFDKPLEAAGSTPSNGSTWYDRTNYVETVPKGALDMALFMESDRMGHLLGALTQDKLDKQRGVVQNEKRQGDNQPYGLSDYAVGDGLFPVGHPYRHATIGSMADLDAASLEDVRQWFKDHYGPNNAVLALAGDIDVATARPLVEKWFGDIARGPVVKPVVADPVTLPAPAKREMTDQVPVLRLSRNWSGPGMNEPDALALQVGLHILGGLSSSRLDTVLVRNEQLAVAVTAGAQPFEQVSFLAAQMDVKPGVDRAKAEARFDQIIAQFVAEGPSADELRRAATSILSSQIGALEEVGGFSGKGATLAEGQLYSNDPAQYKKDLERVAALTPADVKAALQRWLGRPVFSLAVVPGERTEKGEAMGGWGDEAPGAAKPKAAKPGAAIKPGPKRATPPIAPVPDLVVPTIERATLSNGIPIALARRTTIPKVVISLGFDAGYAADALDTPGTQSLMLKMLDEGTTTRSATQIAEEQERLGAQIGSGGSQDTSSITLTALTANLAPSLELMADVARNPAFADSEVARVRDQQQAALSQALANPRALAGRELSKLLYGSHPYGQPIDGLGDAKSLAALTPAALRAAHDKWLRPDLARITVVGDVTMDQLKPLLEKAFGSWQAPATAKPVKDLAASVPAPRPRIVLVDRPNSPQSVIVAGRVLPLTGRTADMEALDLANEVIGGGFLSRLNMDLREDKGWSYGVSTGIRSPAGPRALTVGAPVQADKTGAAIQAIVADMKAFPAKKPIDAEELNRVTDGNIRSLPNRFESNGDVLGAIQQNQLLGRPDDYYATLASRWRAIDGKAIDAMAKTYLQPEGLTFVVVGDRKQVEPQLKRLGMPIEIAPAVDGGSAAGGD
ncbi:M16 family metallopeptidase [Novosphingobium sp. JCM 18896]|uniref:M16 family metallopeptidase n=1 Tax=Novosphingobium sp. JCM 18896 TaxID=2989731 RepID=UPI002221FF5B|nr:pitrilysin family protein [Novosphingobium sp. JCM 18896]MCW1427749.1 insulinase family protein [Novosphingobium sp. JCM 18896]